MSIPQQDNNLKFSNVIKTQLNINLIKIFLNFRQPEEPKKSHMLDLLDVNLSDTASAASTDPWGLPIQPPPQPPRPQVKFSLKSMHVFFIYIFFLLMHEFLCPHLNPQSLDIDYYYDSLVSFIICYLIKQYLKINFGGQR